MSVRQTHASSDNVVNRTEILKLYTVLLPEVRKTATAFIYTEKGLNGPAQSHSVD